MKKVNRREVLKIAALAGGAMLLPVGLQYRGYAQRTDERVEPFTLAFRTPPILNPVRTDSSTDYYQIKMQSALLEILPGRITQIWGYNSIFPGPTIKQRRYRQSVVRFTQSRSGARTMGRLSGAKVSTLPSTQNSRRATERNRISDSGI